MDEFTFHSYAPEYDILQLKPDDWEKQLSSFTPDILFIESAWKGLDGLWQTKISNFSEEISKAIEWCKSKIIYQLFSGIKKTRFILVPLSQLQRLWTMFYN